MKLTLSKEVNLAKEPIGHLLWVLAIPAITSQVVNALYNMVDRMYIGHIPEIGSVALTGVGVCFPLIMIVSAFAYLAWEVLLEPVYTWVSNKTIKRNKSWGIVLFLYVL